MSDISTIIKSTTHNFVKSTTAIFIFILIISGNFLAELLPCRVQHIVRNNMFVKHILGYMTLLFFVIITLPELFTDSFVQVSLFLYIFFLFFSKTYYVFWIVNMGLFSIIYILTLLIKLNENKRNSEKDNINENDSINYDIINNNNESTSERNIDNIQLIQKIRYYLSISVLIFTSFGFLIYLGNKKREYGKKFEYIRFFFGNPKCSNKSPQIDSYVSEISYVFN
tara:strand:+ start:6223 stop:6897 length:675 start_codon:yes stop_codon:yes gene_type:complete